MDRVNATSYDPWARSALNSLRRWLILPLVLAGLGAIAGLYVAGQTRPSAEAVLRVVGTQAGDGAAMRIVQESTVVELDTAPIYEAAADASGITARDLRTRTQIGAVPNSQLISITVTAATTEEAVDQANAIVDAAIEANDRRIESDLTTVTDSTRKLIKDGTLSDPAAEQARVARLGDMLGQNQSNFVVGSRTLTLLHSAESSSLLPTPMLLVAIGLLAGALLGGAIALLVGARRGRIQSARELRRLYPNAAVIDGLDLESVITLESHHASTVYIAGLHHDVTELEGLAAAIEMQFIASGRGVRRHDRPSTVLVADETADLQIVTAGLSETVLRKVSRDSRSLLIIPVRPKSTKLEHLDPFAHRLNDRTYLLVQDEHAGWA